jgi:hypothetical protein
VVETVGQVLNGKDAGNVTEPARKIDLGDEDARDQVAPSTIRATTASSTCTA